jgi:predicted fused transcriptional regulator/phosphomethylpyrimidine kinase/predicted transcriptional regulator
MVTLPSEVVVEQFLPTFRALLAEDLAERGLVQEEIAAHLGVTQAAVSNYRSGAVEHDPRLADDPRMAETVERVGYGLAGGEMDGYDALAEVLALLEEFEDRGPICALHEEAMPALRGQGCDLCVRGHDADRRAERDALAAVRRATRTLVAAPGVASYLPNVGTNVATALPGATDRTDVAAVPGRVYELRGRVEVPAEPEFGASQHVATAVLAASSVDPDIRGGLNLVTDDALLAAARERGVEPVEFDAEYGGRAEHLREQFADGVPRVAFHRGAFGVEPVTYVFGETAVEAAEFAVDLVAAAGSED